MRELTRNEVIKALECCEQHGNCQECPLGGASIKGCMFNVMHEALELIKELIAEIEFCDEQAIHYLGQYEKKSEEYDKAQEEAERYKKYYFHHEYDKWEAEIRADTVWRMQERLKNYLKEEDNGFIGTYWIDQIAKEMLEEKR